MEGRVCVLTGPTSGIGRVMAGALARAGATLVLVARNPVRGEALVRQLTLETGNPEIRLVPADLARRREVEAAAGEIRERYPVVHLLLNNAGAIFGKRQVTDEGHEMTWALNVLAPYLLTCRLAPELRQGSPSRVVNVASAAHRSAHIRWDDPERASHYGGYGAYGQSKLALLLLTYEFARRLSDSGISVHAVHPGFVRTRFGQNVPGGYRWGFRLLTRLFGIPPERGARTPLYAATSAEGGRSTGRYFVRERPVRSSGASYRVEDARRLWEIVRAATGVDLDPAAGAGRRDRPMGPGSSASPPAS